MTPLRVVIWILLLALAAIGCSESKNEPVGPVAATGGWIRAVATSSGVDLDPSGYLVTVDSQIFTIGPNDTMVTSKLLAGGYQVKLGHISSNCSTSSPNPVDSVEVLDGDTTTVVFDVSCGPSQGSMRPGITFTRIDDEPEGWSLDIWVMDTLGQNQHRLTSAITNEFHPRFSPDGNKIAYVVGYSDIWVMNLDGSGKTNLTNSPDYSESRFDWSPDGTRMVYAGSHNDSARTRLFIMNADGSHPRHIFSHPDPDRDVTEPSWSPDGLHIAFNADAGEYGFPQIWIIDTLGQDLQKLEDTNKWPEFLLSPQWSWDGKLLAARGHPVWHRIWVLKPDGTDIHFVSQPVEAPPPAWIPGTNFVSYATPSIVRAVSADYAVEYTVATDGRGYYYLHWNPSP